MNSKQLYEYLEHKSPWMMFAEFHCLPKQGLITPMLGFGMGLGHFLINQTKRLFLDAVILKRVEGVFQVSVGVGRRTRRDLVTS